MRQTIAFLTLTMMGCFSTHGTDDLEPDQGTRDQGSFDQSQDGTSTDSGATSDGMSFDGFMNDIGEGAIPEDWRPLSEELAECIGLDKPECAGCHVVNGQFVFRPKNAPAPTEPAMVDRQLLEDCGFTP